MRAFHKRLSGFAMPKIRQFLRKQSQPKAETSPPQPKMPGPGPSHFPVADFVSHRSVLSKILVTDHDKQIAVLTQEATRLTRSVRRNRLYERPEVVILQVHAISQVAVTKMLSEIGWVSHELAVTQNTLKVRLKGINKAVLTTTNEQRFLAQRAKEREAIRAQLDKIPILQKESEQIEAREEIVHAAREDLLQTVYNNVPPHKRIYHKPEVYALIMGGLFVVEIPINFVAIQMLGDMINLAIVPVTLAISLFVALGAHHIGVSIAEKKRTQTMVISAITILLCLIIISLRFKADGAFALSLLNLVAVGLGSFFAYLRNFDIPYFQLEAQEEEEGINAASKQAEIDRIEANTPKDLKAFDQKIKEDAAQQAEEEIQSLQDAITANEQELNRLDNYKKRRFQEIQGVYDFAVAECKGFTDASRAHSKLESFSWQSIEILPLDFKGPNENNKDDNDDEPRQTSQSGGLLAWSLILLALISLWGCSEPIEKAILVVIDVTEIERDIPVVEDYGPAVLNKAEFHADEVPQDGIRARIGTIIDLSVSPYYAVMLNRSNWLSTNHRDRQVKVDTFVSDFMDGSTFVTPLVTEEYKQSHVFSCLCQNLMPLARSDTLIALIFSDLFENTDSVSFYRYRENLEALYQDDFERIAGIFDRSCPAMTDGSLSSASITVVFMPEKANDPLFRAAKRFWMRYLTDKKGATLRFEPHIRNV